MAALDERLQPINDRVSSIDDRLNAVLDTLLPQRSKTGESAPPGTVAVSGDKWSVKGPAGLVAAVVVVVALILASAYVAAAAMGQGRPLQQRQTALR
jgi:hypothetical protein